MKSAACCPRACHRKRSPSNRSAINKRCKCSKNASPSNMRWNPRNRKLAVTLNANKPGFEENMVSIGLRASATTHECKRKPWRFCGAPARRELQNIHENYSEHKGTSNVSLHEVSKFALRSYKYG